MEKPGAAPPRKGTVYFGALKARQVEKIFRAFSAR